MLLPLLLHARSALVIVDMQEFFFRKPERRQNLDQVIANINTLIEYFDVRWLPTFHIVSKYKADRSDWDLKMKMAGEPELIEDAPETAILAPIRISESHAIISKTRYSAFFKTDLAERLHQQNIARVVVVGAYTHYCVNATIFDAYGHDFVPCLITDAVTSHRPDETALMIERMRRNGYHIFTTAKFIAANPIRA
ncbi:MAG: cysteine hydrolase [Anaerolineales bacterium]|nr:cysteine hydrolase [Anaerolineales bacterium]